jgi:hypothetical protein
MSNSLGREAEPVAAPRHAKLPGHLGFRHVSGILPRKTPERKHPARHHRSFVLKGFKQAQMKPQLILVWLQRSEAIKRAFTSVVKKRDGKYRSTGRIVISRDGKSYTLTAKGTNADGKPYMQTIVYEKQ